MPQERPATLIAGIDTGGTFTDTIMIDTESKNVYLNKVSSTPQDPSIAFINGLNKTGQNISSLKRITHGTTHAINTIIQRKGAITGLITTRGFRDILEIRRGNRPRGRAFDLQWTKPKPLVPRYLRVGVKERVDADGNVLCELDKEHLLKAVHFLMKHGVNSIAICFLFSYRNPIHEKNAKEMIQKKFPNLYISISSEILPEWREYERSCATVADAYIKMVMSNYIGNLEKKLKTSGYNRPFYIMNSNGGIMTSNITKEQPVQTFLSGPVAGVVAANFIGKKAGFDDLISIDMGGTSFDSGIIRKGKFIYTTEKEIEEGVPVKISMLDIRTIGAGGGSIAWIDSGGVLKVGPQSAGADPGPVCYRTGGEDPTVTDANLVLGRLNPEYFLGGEQKLEVDLAKEVIQDKIAGPLNLPLIEAALGIIKVVVVNMAQDLRVITTERGYDPRKFALVAFGGAGPLHAALIAREMGIKHVVVPPYPGITSAIGLLLSDLKFDTVRSLYSCIERDGTDLIAKYLSEMLRQGITLIEDEGYIGEPICQTSLDMRYRGQNYQINIPVDKNNLSVEDIAQRFDERHKYLYGFSLQGTPHEVLLVRTSVIGKVLEEDDILKTFSVIEKGESTAEPVELRKVWEDSNQLVDCKVYKRVNLSKKIIIEGPAVIEEMDSTVIVPSWSQAATDPFGNLLISINIA